MSSRIQARRSLTWSILAATVAFSNAALAAPDQKNQFAVPLKPVSAQQEKANADTAKAINKVPGVHLQGQDLQPPAQDPQSPVSIRSKEPLLRLCSWKKTVSNCNNRL